MVIGLSARQKVGRQHPAERVQGLFFLFLEAIIRQRGPNGPFWGRGLFGIGETQHPAESPRFFGGDQHPAEKAQ